MLTKGLVKNKEMLAKKKEEYDALLVTILLKWISVVLFFKGFWIVEKFLFLIPTSPVKLWIGLWILLPNFRGEFFFYNLISDKLEKFEQKMRFCRNYLADKFTNVLLFVTKWTLKGMKNYILTDNLKNIQGKLQDMESMINTELNLRKELKKRQNKPESLIRDSIILNSEDTRILKIKQDTKPPSRKPSQQKSEIPNIDECEVNRSSISAYQRRKMYNQSMLNDQNQSFQIDQEPQSRGTMSKRVIREVPDASPNSNSKQHKITVINDLVKKDRSGILSTTHSAFIDDDDLLEQSLKISNKKMPRMDFISNVEKSMDIASNSNKLNVPIHKPNDRYSVRTTK